MERVLVSGGAGFIGSHIVDLLRKEKSLATLTLMRSLSWGI